MNILFQNTWGRLLEVDDNLATFIFKLIGLPHVGGRIRLKLLDKMMKENDECSFGKILDAGCGYGFGSMHFAKKGLRVTGVDIDTDKIKTAKLLALKANLNIKYKVASIYELPFKSDSFDVCVSLEVLEHLEDDDKGLFEIFRVVKKGGYCIISFPEKVYNTPGFKEAGHVRGGYTKEQMIAKMDNLRFKLVKIYSYGNTKLGKYALSLSSFLSQRFPVLSVVFFPLFYLPVLVDANWFMKSKSASNYLALFQKLR